MTPIPEEEKENLSERDREMMKTPEENLENREEKENIFEDLEEIKHDFNKRSNEQNEKMMSKLIDLGHAKFVGKFSSGEMLQQFIKERGTSQGVEVFPIFDDDGKEIIEYKAYEIDKDAILKGGEEIEKIKEENRKMYPDEQLAKRKKMIEHIEKGDAEFITTQSYGDFLDSVMENIEEDSDYDEELDKFIVIPAFDDSRERMMDKNGKDGLFKIYKKNK